MLEIMLNYYPYSLVVVGLVIMYRMCKFSYYIRTHLSRAQVIFVVGGVVRNLSNYQHGSLMRPMKILTLACKLV